MYNELVEQKLTVELIKPGTCDWPSVGVVIAVLL